MAADIEARIKEIVCDRLGVKADEVTPAATFIEDLGADSLDIVELVMELEQEYGVEIPDEDVEKLQTVKNVVDYVSSHKTD